MLRDFLFLRLLCFLSLFAFIGLFGHSDFHSTFAATLTSRLVLYFPEDIDFSQVDDFELVGPARVLSLDFVDLFFRSLILDVKENALPVWNIGEIDDLASFQ